MNLALIGPSGAGKGSQAAKLRERYPLQHLSSGDLLREAVNSPLGRRALHYIREGELVPDDLVDALINEQIRRAPADTGMLLDGFPRTHEQALFLDELLEELGAPLSGVIYLDLDEAPSIDRLRGRIVCSHCHTIFHASWHTPRHAGKCDICGHDLHARFEDSPLMASSRWRAFERRILPVLRHYQKRGILHIVDASQPIEKVQDAVLELAENIRQRTAVGCTLQAVGRAVHVPSLPHIAHAGPNGTFNFVLLGAPGSGKGTQAERILASETSVHVASGELFRQNLAQKTELGELARSYMNRGELVPDDVTEAMIEQKLEALDGRSFVLDGFPRTLPQAEALTHMLAGLGRPLAAVLHIDVCTESLVERLSGRWICRGCQAPYHQLFKPPQSPGVCDKCGGQLYQREDDKAETVRARLKTYARQTEPLLDYYARSGLLVTIDGNADVQAVSQRTAEAIARVKDYLEHEAKFERHGTAEPAMR
jgi:adenylate kinase